MRKSIVVFIFMLVSALLISCTKDVELERNVADLEKAGFSIVSQAKSEQELESYTIGYNNKIKFNGGDFTVNIVGFTALNKTEDENYYSCQFVSFETSNQAEQYYDLYIESRAQNDDYRLRLFEDIVVFTNSDEAMDIVTGEFN